VGIITPKLDEFTKNRLEFRRRISRIGHTLSPEEVHEHGERQATLSTLVSLARPTKRFPDADHVTVTVLCSKASKVLHDFTDGLADRGTLVVLNASMGDAISLAAAIRAARGDVLAVIRGGGEPEQLAAFNDIRVLEALATHPAYCVTGLGHAGDHTLADLVADYSASVPAQAGQHIREQVDLRAAQRLPHVRRSTAPKRSTWNVILAAGVGFLAALLIIRLLF
jgi:hypothetical protein